MGFLSRHGLTPQVMQVCLRCFGAGVAGLLVTLFLTSIAATMCAVAAMSSTASLRFWALSGAPRSCATPVFFDFSRWDTADPRSRVAEATVLPGESLGGPDLEFSPSQNPSLKVTNAGSFTLGLDATIRDSSPPAMVTAKVQIFASPEQSTASSLFAPFAPEASEALNVTMIGRGMGSAPIVPPSGFTWLRRVALNLLVGWAVDWPTDASTVRIPLMKDFVPKPGFRAQYLIVTLHTSRPDSSFVVYDTSLLLNVELQNPLAYVLDRHPLTSSLLFSFLFFAVYLATVVIFAFVAICGIAVFAWEPLVDGMSSFIDWPVSEGPSNPPARVPRAIPRRVRLERHQPSSSDSTASS